MGRSIDYPAVLKPRRASGSWHTFLVASVDALGELWDELTAEEPEAFLLEEYLPDGPPMPGGFEADYVSVESVFERGRVTHLAITGRFPLALRRFARLAFSFQPRSRRDSRPNCSTSPARLCARSASRSAWLTPRSS